MLPAGLELAAQDFMPGKRHPLVLILGQQSDVRPRLLPLGADYLETIVAVPFVQLRERAHAAARAVLLLPAPAPRPPLADRRSDGCCTATTSAAP